jgi:midasin (ATPase involved in ribosome maturation)
VNLPFGNKFSFEKARKCMQIYNINAPTTAYNALRVAHSITNVLRKPILLESSPGVGKTSLI